MYLYSFFMFSDNIFSIMPVYWIFIRFFYSFRKLFIAGGCNDAMSSNLGFQSVVLGTSSAVGLVAHWQVRRPPCMHLQCPSIYMYICIYFGLLTEDSLLILWTMCHAYCRILTRTQSADWGSFHMPGSTFKTTLSKRDRCQIYFPYIISYVSLLNPLFNTRTLASKGLDLENVVYYQVCIFTFSIFYSFKLTSFCIMISSIFRATLIILLWLLGARLF